MSGGPVVFACLGCGHDVHGSAIDHEYRSTVPAGVTHILTARSLSGERLNPVTYGSPTFRYAYGLPDVEARQARAAKDGAEVDVTPVTRRTFSEIAPKAQEVSTSS
jgi:hypothetical protein